MEGAGVLEMLRVIREQEPTRPSTKLSTAEGLPALAANRNTDPARLTRLVRGELDWIAMKALEKDRTRRYESASALAADVQRYLHNEPVEAGPPSALYRFRKFASRHRVVLASAAVSALALLAAAGISSWQAVRARQAEASAALGWDAEKAERQRAERAERQAKERLFEGKVALSEASQWSGRPGQRFASLAAIKEAVALAAELKFGEKVVLDLRNRAIISLTRADIHHDPDRPLRKWLGEFQALDGPWHVSKFNSEKVTLEHRTDSKRRWDLPVTGFVGRPELSACNRYLILTVGGGEKRELQVWDVEARKLLVQVGGAVLADVSDDSRCLVAALDDGSLRVFDLPAGTERKRIPFGPPRASVLAVAPGGRLAAVVRSLEVHAIDLETGKTIGTHSGGAITSSWRMAWHPHGKRLAMARGPQLTFWEPGSGAVPVVVQGHQRGTNALAFHRTGLVLATSGGDGAVRLWDSATGKQLCSLPLRARQVRFGGDDTLTYVDRSLAGELHVAPGRECRTVAHGLVSIREVDISPDGRWLAALAADGIRVWATESGREVAFIKDRQSLSIAFDPASTDLIARGNYFGNRHELRLAEGLEECVQVITKREPDDAEIRPRGAFLFADPAGKRPFRGVVSRDGRWRVKGLISIPVFGPAARLPRPVPDRSEAVPVNPGLPTLTDLDTGAVFELPGAGELMLGGQLALSPDAGLLVIGAAENYYLWRTSPLKRYAVLSRQPSNTIGPVAFSPDGRTLALAREPSRIALMAPETLEVFATLEVPDVLTALCFSPDGRWLSAATLDGRIQVWDLPAVRRQLADIGLDWRAP
jgi:WD40 repeat protein